MGETYDPAAAATDPDDRPGQKIPTLDPLSSDVKDEKTLTKWEKWLEWAEKNAKPRIRKYPKKPRPKSRWAKSPMTEQDWEEFDDWADERAEPKVLKEPPEPPPPKSVELSTLLPRLTKLSKPKRITPRYVYKKPELTFVPAIAHGEPARKEPRRKMKKPVMRKCFPNIEMEAEFFRFQLKFEVYESALTYEIIDRIKQLALPRKWPPTPHCPIPVVKEVIPKRIKMSRKQWIWHLRHLIYFASARKELPPTPPYPRGKKRPINKLMKRVLTLSKPKKSLAQKEREEGVRKSALKAQASARTVALAKAKHNTEKFKPSKEGTGVKKSALTVTATPRVVELAKPKTHPEPPPLKKRFRKKEKIDLTCAIYVP